MIQRRTAHTLVHQVQYELPGPDQNILRRLSRLSYTEKGLLPLQEISPQTELLNPDEARAHGVALFVGYIAYNAFGDDPELAGFATTTRHEEEPNEVHLNRFYVHPSARGRGLGEALAKAFVDFARERNATHAQYDSTEPGPFEQHIFENLKFKPTSTGQLRLPLARNVHVPRQRLVSGAQLLYPSPHGS